MNNLTPTESRPAPVADLTPYQKTIARARALHEECCSHATKAVKAAIQCGALLREARKTFGHSDRMSEQEAVYGQWGPFLEAAGISVTTARRYMAVAASFDAQSQHLLEGKSLSDLYRELGLIKAAAGGGNRLGGEELARRRAEDQMTFHFTILEDAFKEVTRYAEKTGHANPFESLDSETLGQTREQLTNALALVDAALAAN